jgi:hypothetical protein
MLSTQTERVWKNQKKSNRPLLSIFLENGTHPASVYAFTKKLKMKRSRIL